jgi:hypothetical protein
VVVRETIRERPAARGRKLLEVPGYTFHVLVTTLRHAPGPTWRFYNSRAESENRIKELKQDFGADANASPRCWHASRPSQFQLWRSSPPTKNILCPGLGNRLRRASNHPYFQRSNQVFGLK